MEAQKLAFADHIDQGIEEWKTSFLVGLTESFDKQLKATHALAEQALALALAKDKKANNPDDAADVDAQKPAGVGNEGSDMGVGNEDNPSEAILNKSEQNSFQSFNSLNSDSIDMTFFKPGVLLV